MNKDNRSNIAASLTSLIFRHRWLILLIYIGGLALGIYILPDVSVQSAIDDMMIEGDPALESYRRLHDIFGKDSLIVVALKPPKVFEESFLHKLQSVTERIEQLSQVKRAISLTNAPSVIATEDEITVGAIMEQVPSNAQEMQDFRKRVFAADYLVDTIISKDATVTSINIQAIIEGDEDRQRKKLVSDVIDIVESGFGEDVEYHLSGDIVLIRKVSMSISRNLVTFAPLAVFILFVMLLVIFRQFYGALMPVVTFVSAITGTLTLITLSGNSLNIITTILPPLLLVIGTTNVVHFLARYQEEYDSYHEKQAALHSALEHVMFPCFLASFTTAVGFSSLIISDIKPIRQFGYYSAFGIMLAYVIAMTVVPVVMQWFPKPRLTFKVIKRRTMISRLLDGVSRLNARYYWKIAAMTFFVVIIMAWGIYFLKVETNFLSYYYKNDPIKIAFDFIETHLTGTATIDLIIEAQEDDMVKEPRLLKAADRYMKRAVEEIPELDKFFSIIDLIKQMNKAMHGDDPAYYRIPDTRAEVSQYLLLYETSGEDVDLGFLVDYSYRRMHMQGRLHNCSSRRMEHIADTLRAYARQLEAELPGIDMEVTGTSALFAAMANNLVYSQIKTFGLAMVLIIIVMTVMTRSVSVGLLAMVPNIVPLAITFGAMGYIGIALNTATSMIASIAIGIAVDDTIHYLVRHRREYAKLGDHHRAMDRALHTVGRAMTYTTLVVAIGFSVVVLSDYKPFLYFGTLMCLTMFSALLGDIVILPVLILIFKPRFKGNTIHHADDRPSP